MMDLMRRHFLFLLEISQGRSNYLSKAEKINQDNAVTIRAGNLLAGLSCLTAVIFPTYSTALEKSRLSLQTLWFLTL